jgi:DnaK suppressor protein
VRSLRAPLDTPPKLDSVSRGFRDADSTQEQSEKANSITIDRILEQDRLQAARSAERRARGTYGICEDCSGEIGAERLDALPDATRCIRCQVEWEASNR